MLKRCTTCRGRKKVFSIGGKAITYADMGGQKIDCPHCNGAGVLPDAIDKPKRRKSTKKVASDGK